MESLLIHHVHIRIILFGYLSLQEKIHDFTQLGRIFMMGKLSVLTGSFNCQWLRGKNRHAVHPCWEPIEVWHAVHMGICNMWFYGASSAEDKSTCHETGKADVKSNGRFLHANLWSICHHLALLRYMYMKTVRTGASSKSKMLAKQPKTILKKRYAW